MPLRDHFTEPVDFRLKWESFHSYWAVSIGSLLNRVLPKRFHAAVQQHHGSRIEADVLEYDLGSNASTNGTGGGVALQTYAPPQATGVLNATFPDEVEVPIVDLEDSDNLVAVIELASPSNKHDPMARRAFAGKCASYLSNGVGLIVVDLVFKSHFNLHDELLAMIVPKSTPSSSWSYAAAYRPIRRDDTNQIDYWLNSLAVGEPLPTLPLCLKGWGSIPLDLEETYQETCRLNRIV